MNKTRTAIAHRPRSNRNIIITESLLINRIAFFVYIYPLADLLKRLRRPLRVYIYMYVLCSPLVKSFSGNYDTQPKRVRKTRLRAGAARCMGRKKKKEENESELPREKE